MAKIKADIACRTMHVYISFYFKGFGMVMKLL